MATLEQTHARAVTTREATAYLLWAAVLLAVLGGLAAVVWYAAPETDWVSLGAVDAFPPGEEPYFVEGGNDLFYVFSDGEGYTVYDPTAPGSRCQLKWVPSNHRYEDPCYGSKFDTEGGWIEGPAPHGMVAYEAEVRDGVLWVNRWVSQPGPPQGKNKNA